MRSVLLGAWLAFGLAATVAPADAAAPAAKSGVQKAGDAVQETGAKTQAGVKRGLKRADRGVRKGVDAASRGVDKARKKLHLPDGPPPPAKEP
jgi:hypothetical protein